MPPLPGHELPPPPPASPRELPAGYEFHSKWSGNIAVIIGLIFTVLSALFTYAALLHKSWGAVVPGLMLLAGFSVFRYGRNKAVRIIRAARHGTAIAGEVASLNIDTTMSVNHKHPWKLAYHFTVDGHVWEGTVVTFDTTVAKKHHGQPLWVVYMPDDPAQNSLYPPVKTF